MFSKSNLKAAGVGFLWFLGYLAVHQFVVRPAAQKYGVPIVKDL
jgi:hypothetical protein